MNMTRDLPWADDRVCSFRYDATGTWHTPESISRSDRSKQAQKHRGETAGLHGAVVEAVSVCR